MWFVIFDTIIKMKGHKPSQRVPVVLPCDKNNLSVRKGQRQRTAIPHSPHLD